ncbi:hypothetical protein RZS08_46940, partial [Arthrospira platensis SPKY1]|nr:hypothetical protein [Arthrospira platensis SPKY1]
MLSEVEISEEDQQGSHGAAAWAKQVAFVVIGIGLLVLGSDLMVREAVELAVAFGMSTLLVSLTIVAIGTSLPEIATSVVAAYRGEGDIAVGNIVGS